MAVHIECMCVAWQVCMYVAHQRRQFVAVHVCIEPRHGLLYVTVAFGKPSPHFGCSHDCVKSSAFYVIFQCVSCGRIFYV